MTKSRALVMVEPNAVEILWTGDPKNLPLKIVVDAMPAGPEVAPDDHYDHVGDPVKIQAALVTENSAMAGWDDDKFTGDSCYFEWRSPDESNW